MNRLDVVKGDLLDMTKDELNKVTFGERIVIVQF